MKLAEMRDKTIDELNEEIIDLRKKSFEFRLNKSLYKLEDTSQISKTKNQISQLKTVIREKQLQNSRG
ncbi:MAG: 50S ribosomal protein L29 [bacterium]